jgi:hypothetical protein
VVIKKTKMPMPSAKMIVFEKFFANLKKKFTFNCYKKILNLKKHLEIFWEEGVIKKT